MTNSLPSAYVLHPDVVQALKRGTPLVALESTVLTHGLPFPQNLELGLQVENEIRSQGAQPATIAILNGKIHIGVGQEELALLVNPATKARKVSRRDFGIALARREVGGTTVAGTLISAYTAGLRVFSTGGIGGVHRQSNFDISADLQELSRTPMIVVCAGAKAILDLPATQEVLETLGVPIIGYQTDEFPAFYSRQSGLPVTVRVDTPAEVAAVATAQWDLGLTNAILVVNPPPAEAALPHDDMEAVILQAMAEAQKQGISGPQLTPFLLGRVSELSGGASLRANLALLRSNARLAAQIARQLPAKPQ